MKSYKRIFKEDLIPGGKADKVEIIKAYDSEEKEYFSVNIEQIKKGLRVESEHAEDPAEMLEIVLDHLVEFDNYYDRLEKAESDDWNDNEKEEEE